MKEHPQADILRAIADGKEIEVRSSSGYGWYVPRNVLGLISESEVSEQYEFRIKPDDITINGHEVPAPVREPLERGQEYCSPDIYHPVLVCKFVWGEDGQDTRWLKRGLIHLTEKAAIAHAEALLSFTRSDR